MRDLKFVPINTSVSFLRPFSEYTKNYIYASFTMIVKNGYYGEY